MQCEGGTEANSLNVVGIEIIPNADHVRAKISQASECGMLHDMVRYVKVELDDRKRREGPDGLAAEEKVAFDVPGVAAVAVRRLLNNRVRVAPEGPDEPPSGRLGCHPDGILPEP